MTKPSWIIGIDEVGRGPLAGPVYVCGVAMKASQYKVARWKGLTDSKQMTVRARQVWFEIAKELKGKGVVRISLAKQSARAVDRYGINVCIAKCIEVILKDLATEPPSEYLVLLDGGLRAPESYINQQTIIRGDQKKKIISLASVIAKVTRDALMQKLDSKYPEYRWGRNKGYGTSVHIEAIQEHGVTPEHRMTYLSRVLDKNQ